MFCKENKKPTVSIRWVGVKPFCPRDYPRRRAVATPTTRMAHIIRELDMRQRMNRQSIAEAPRKSQNLSGYLYEHCLFLCRDVSLDSLVSPRPLRRGGNC